MNKSQQPKAGAKAKNAIRKQRMVQIAKKSKAIKRAAKKAAKQSVKKLITRLPYLTNTGTAGAAEWLHSYFESDTGIHRGLSSAGAPNTALSYQSDSFDVNIPAGTYFTMAVVPPVIYSNKWITYAYGTGMTTPALKTMTAGAGITNGVVLSPFSTDPSINARVAHCSVTMQETTNLLNQAGVWNVAYFPEFAQGQLASNSDIVPAYTTVNFNSQKYNRQYNGVVGEYNQPLLQWFPSAQEEMDFISNNGITDPANNPFSGFGAFLFNPTTNAISIRVTYKIGIEYNPNDSYRRFVETKPPLVHPSAPYDLTMLVLENWNKVALTTPGDLKDFLGRYATLPGFNQVFNAGAATRAAIHSISSRYIQETARNASGLRDFMHIITE